MSKSSKSTKNKGNTPFIVAAALIALGLAAVVLLNSGRPAAEGSAAAQLITPQGYQEQFVNAGAAHALIDVRTPQEFASGHIAGAVNIPVDQLASRLSEIPAGQPVVVYCRSGNRSAQASQILARAGYSSIYDLGGIIGWTAQGYPVQ
jgi:rhodanese-related sulfurtransferase